MTRLLAPLFVLLALAPAALAQTRALPPGEIRANGDITFGNALKIGKRDAGKTIITPDTLQILGPGSTGDASLMTAPPSASAPANSLSRLLADRAPLASPVFTGAPFAPGMRVANGVPPSVSYPFAGFSNSKTAHIASVTGQSEAGPEFAGSFQLVSNGGSSDKFANFKVALTSVYQALPGAADGWAANFVASSTADVADKTGLIGLEINLNNNHFQATGDISSPYTAGLYMTGTGSKTSMAGILVAGDRPIYRDGLHFEDKSAAGSRAITNATINDQTKSPNILVSNTAHTNGIDFVNSTFSGFAFRSPGFSVDGSGNATAKIANLTSVSIDGSAGAGISIAGSHTLGVDLVNGIYSAFAFRSPGFSVSGAGNVTTPTANVNSISVTGTAGAVMSVAGSHTLGVDLINGTFGAFAFRSTGFTVDGAGSLSAAALSSAGGITGATVQAGTVNATTKLIAAMRTIATSSTACTAGEIAFDSTYLYTCVATNSWRRTNLGSAW